MVCPDDPIAADAKTAGGIIIPDTAKEKPQEGEIIAAGPGARNEQGQLDDRFHETSLDGTISLLADSSFGLGRNEDYCDGWMATCGRNGIE
jgi:hypothetical protein